MNQLNPLFQNVRFWRDRDWSIETITGAGGGVIFTPFYYFDRESREIVEGLRDQLSEKPHFGGYIYLSDLLSTPSILNSIGRIIAKGDQKIDAVMTVLLKEFHLLMPYNTLNVPFVIVRRDLKITEGSTVSVNYVSIPKRSKDVL